MKTMTSQAASWAITEHIADNANMSSVDRHDHVYGAELNEPGTGQACGTTAT